MFFYYDREMSEIRLIRPTKAYVGEMIQFQQEIGLEDAGYAAGSEYSESEIQDWMDYYFQEEQSHVYIAVRQSDQKVVGVTDVRKQHSKEELYGKDLEEWGGYIGLTVRPGERRKGYAREILKQNLNQCRERGIEKILVTCESSNVASKKLIFENHGRFDCRITVDGMQIERYWIYM